LEGTTTGVRRSAEDTTVLALALRFDPMFVYIALGIAATVAVGRLLLGWAIDSS
jgi:hypothetical protein